ncbi:TPA: DUF805 domain-containing protein [Klebsiella pneumoniae]
MNAYLNGFKKYFDFSSRSSRHDFWMFMLFATIVNLIAAVADQALLSGSEGENGPIFLLVNLVQLIPSIAVSVRRLHDTDRSGWLLLIAFIPLIGVIALIIFYCQASQPNTNRFGPNPYGLNNASSNFAATSSNGNQNSQSLPLDELEKLSSLRQSGSITEDEFSVMKSKILSSKSSA